MVSFDLASERERHLVVLVIDRRAGFFSTAVRQLRCGHLRRLERHRPDILDRVLAGELSVHAGMIEAGFRKPQGG
jgi:hypothetical protein